ncbi:MAG: type II secretion system protein [Ruminococcus sp.]|nr:type II secretion system protein [Ruminococcus sp.]
MNKKIQKGFTLVELVVVMAIMGIIMTVIMSIIGPTSRIASKVESMKDEETTSMQVSRYVKNELSYATKVYITAINDGEAEPTAPETYKYVYVIDNVTPRTGSVKGAKGLITIRDWNGSGSTKEEIVTQNEIWGEDEFNISLEEYSAIAGSSFVTLAFRGYPMVYKEGSYKADTAQEYIFKDTISFININNREQIKKGGNSNANNYTVQIDESVKDKKDKIYIFFLPAANTALQKGGVLVDPTAEPGTGGGSEDPGETPGGGGTTPTTPEEPPQDPVETVVGSASFYFSDGTNHVDVDVIQIYDPNDSSTSYKMDYYPDDQGLETKPDYEKYDWLFRGWFESPSPGDGEAPLNIGNVGLGTVGKNFYPVYEQVDDKYAVTFYSYDGTTELQTIYVTGGDTISDDAIVTPAPDDENYVFYRWIPLGIHNINDQIMNDCSFKAEQTLRKGYVTIHFVDNFNGNINCTSTNAISGSAYPVFPYNTATGNLMSNVGPTHAYGEDAKVAAQGGTMEGYRFSYDDTDITLKPSGGQSCSYHVGAIDFAYKDLYYYINTEGKPVLSESNNKVESKVVFSLVKPVSTADIRVSNGANYAGIGGDFANPSSNLMLENVSDSSIRYISTNCTFTLNDGAQLTVQDDGNDHYITIYQQLNGDKNIIEGPVPVTTRQIIYFIEDVPGADIYFSGDGKVALTYDGSIKVVNLGGSKKNCFDIYSFGENDELVVKFDSDTTITIGDMNLALENDGGDRYTYYYNGHTYGSREEAEEAFIADHPVTELPAEYFGGVDPEGDPNAVTFVFDVPKNTQYKRLYFQVSNVNIDVYEAKSGSKLQLKDGNCHYDISPYSNQDTRFIVKMTGFPSWVNSNNPIRVNSGLRKGDWNGDDEFRPYDNEAFTAADLNSVKRNTSTK